ncbi:MAG: HAMP domain-containing histidine kinase [Pseudomonadota bacterium]|nr:HAMP domain-containing histidine kinase [Pseudomonadota bacterium]
MRLSQFILAHLPRIMQEWDRFAETLATDRPLTAQALRDDAERMLRFIARNIDSQQSPAEQANKSKGVGPAAIDEAAHSHGVQRLAEGFTLAQMISEFRALRAVVTRLWITESGGALVDEGPQLIRFNEAIDQILAESVARFTSKVDRDKDLFLAVLGHDLRNPLNAITLSAAALLRSKSLVPNDHVIAERITESGKRMDRMLEDLVDFTRTRLGARAPLRRAPCDLGDIVRKATGELQLAHPGRSIAVEVTGDTSGTWDGERIAQLVSNLVANALKHGARAAPVTVSVSGSDDDASGVVLEVRNPGPAIPPQFRGEIFDALRRGAGDEASARNHLGLGLYIAREIATAHEGRVELVSSDPHETIFRAWLPR